MRSAAVVQRHDRRPISCGFGDDAVVAYAGRLRPQRAAALRQLESSAPMSVATVALTRNSRPSIPLPLDEQRGSRHSDVVVFGDDQRKVKS